MAISENKFTISLKNSNFSVPAARSNNIWHHRMEDGIYASFIIWLDLIVQVTLFGIVKADMSIGGPTYNDSPIQLEIAFVGNPVTLYLSSLKGGEVEKIAMLVSI
ncbi:unnamed protein product [Cuscuta epithymum]|uniref:Uncharacterized protein n=1 Tax=Cuscuta epithymum TaxID=186058 RepID=A0AAV0EN59_9ASTE|nr:unnamed protein product [Cuscuta epithymum]